MGKHITIDGIDYIEKPDTELPFGNVCKLCAFYGIACYNRVDFNCHADSRPDGVGVVFIKRKEVIPNEANFRERKRDQEHD